MWLYFTTGRGVEKKGKGCGEANNRSNIRLRENWPGVRRRGGSRASTKGEAERQPDLSLVLGSNQGKRSRMQKEDTTVKVGKRKEKKWDYVERGICYQRTSHYFHRANNTEGK